MNSHSSIPPVLVSGMGRSGTTWVGDLINYDNTYRELFEPFFPGRVQEADCFNYIQYLNPQTEDAHLENQAQTILAGKLRNNWVDRKADALQNPNILVKEIRTNLMLGWLKRIVPGLKIVVLIRHPLQVVHSWFRMGWGRNAQGTIRDIDLILSQERMLQDYPEIINLSNMFNLDDYFESVVFQWCLFNYIPQKQLQASENHVLYYEDLILKPYQALEDLFCYLERPYQKETLCRNLSIPSQTNYLLRDPRKDKQYLLNGWREAFTQKQKDKAISIVGAFGLGNLYTDTGIPAGTLFFGC